MITHVAVFLGVLVGAVVGACMLVAFGISRGEDTYRIDGMTKVVCTLSGVCCMLLFLIDSMGNSYARDVDVDIKSLRAALEDREAVYEDSLSDLESEVASLRNTMRIRETTIVNLESQVEETEQEKRAALRAAKLECLTEE